MAIKTMEGGRIVLSNAAYFHVTPYVNEGELGTETYDIVDIVADSLSFTPDDNNINSKESEFTDAPLFENITLGKIQFAATCVDFRNEVMKALFGWSVGASGTIYAPNSYKDLYAVVEVGFKNSDVAVVVPKLKLNSKAVISTLKTGSGEGQLAGTAYDAALKVGEDESTTTPMAFVAVADGVTYEITVGSKTATFKVGEGIEASAE
jgi:hypothetical protein